MIHLSVSNISRCHFLSEKKLKKIVEFIFDSVGVKNANIAIVFSSDRQITRLNYLYRRKNRPTDVLSFSMREGMHLKKDSSVLGDIIISVDRAKKQAARFNSTFKKEMYLYIIHGILHLLGYDDEKPSSRKRMQRRETEILNKLCKKIK